MPMHNELRQLAGLEPIIHKELEKGEEEEEKKLWVQIFDEMKSEVQEAKLKYENALKESEIECRKIAKMTPTEILVYCNIIKPLKKPLTDEEVSSKLDMMLQMKALALPVKRAKREEDDLSRKKKCLDPEEEKRIIDLCHEKMKELNKSIKFVGFNETENYDWKKEIEDKVIQHVWDGPIELDGRTSRL